MFNLNKSWLTALTYVAKICLIRNIVLCLGYSHMSQYSPLWMAFQVFWLKLNKSENLTISAIQLNLLLWLYHNAGILLIIWWVLSHCILLTNILLLQAKNSGLRLTNKMKLDLKMIVRVYTPLCFIVRSRSLLFAFQTTKLTISTVKEKTIHYESIVPSFCWCHYWESVRTQMLSVMVYLDSMPGWISPGGHPSGSGSVIPILSVLSSIVFSCIFLPLPSNQGLVKSNVLSNEHLVA